jgi:flagellar hook assembly protein FlgD
MKKLALVIVVLMGVSTTSGLLASGLPVLNPKKTLVLKEEGSLRFSLKSANLEDKSNLVIKNAYGETVYQENIKEVSLFTKTYDFSSLPDGDYQIVLKSGKDILTKTFEIKTEVIRKGAFVFTSISVNL